MDERNESKIAYTSVNDSPRASSISNGKQWRPYSLQGWWLFSLGLYTLTLILTVALLYRKSVHNNGLVEDNGAAHLVFASRYVPTLLAVTYVLVATILVDDVKRTEPYACLAVPGGALAQETLLEEPLQWWACLWRSFPNRNTGRKMNPTMLCSILVYLLATFVLAPLSASLLTSQVVSVATPTQFSAINLNNYGTLHMEASYVSYFRTIAHMLQNVSTSAWISDSYFVLPFAPSLSTYTNLGPVLNNPGPFLSNEAQSWRANTTVFNAGLTCQLMSLTNVSVEVAVLDPGSNLTVVNTSAILSSGSDCTFGILYPASDDPYPPANLADLATYGGGSWSTSASMQLGMTAAGRDNFQDPINYSGDYINVTSCSGELLFITNNTVVTSEDAESNQTPNTHFHAMGYICDPEYYMANIPINMELSQDSSTFEVDHEEFHANRIPISKNYIDTDSFQSEFLDIDWDFYLVPVTDDRPVMGGPINLLGGLYNYSMHAMMYDEGLVQKMSALKQRYFGEMMLDVISSTLAFPLLETSGTIFTTQKRLVVVEVTALAIAITLTFQLLLLCAVYYASSASRRPLGLLTDPATALATASIIQDHDDTRRHLASDKFSGQSRLLLQQGSLRLIELGAMTSTAGRWCLLPTILID